MIAMMCGFAVWQFAEGGVLFVIENDGAGTLFHSKRSSDGWSPFEDALDLFREGGAIELQRAGIRQWLLKEIRIDPNP